MGNLFEFLPLIVFIIYGILKAMSGGNNKEQPKQSPKQRNIPRPTPTPSGGQNIPEKTIYQSSSSSDVTQEQRQRIPKQPEYTSSTMHDTIEEQHKQQMKRLKGRLDSGNITTSKSSVDHDKDVSIGPAIQDAIKHHSLQDQTRNKERFKKHVRKGLNYKGLVNGIIMSEVLGPPRARKTYRSVTAERRRKIHY